MPNHTPPSRRSVLTGLGASALGTSALGLSACETLDPAILEGIMGGVGALSQGDAAAGIRAALNNGIGHAIGTVGVQNGFLGNDLIRIPLPRKLQEVQNVMTQFGAGGLLNNLQTQLNRGAEKAAPVAKSIFVDAVSSLSIQGAIGIVRGADNAATTYLQDRTTPKLVQLFSPIMENALGDTGALRLLDQVDSQLSSVPMVAGLGASARTDLISHGVQYGLSGVFTYIGEEERLIRENPAKRTSEILRRVFGASV